MRSHYHLGVPKETIDGCTGGVWKRIEVIALEPRPCTGKASCGQSRDAAPYEYASLSPAHTPPAGPEHKPPSASCGRSHDNESRRCSGMSACSTATDAT